jgi:hypothetical protein
VIVAQTAALNNQRTAINILGNRLNATVLLIKALGGGWKASDLPMKCKPPPRVKEPRSSAQQSHADVH